MLLTRPKFVSIRLYVCMYVVCAYVCMGICICVCMFVNMHSYQMSQSTKHPRSSVILCQPSYIVVVHTYIHNPPIFYYLVNDTYITPYLPDKNLSNLMGSGVTMYVSCCIVKPCSDAMFW